MWRKEKNRIIRCKMVLYPEMVRQILEEDQKHTKVCGKEIALKTEYESEKINEYVWVLSQDCRKVVHRLCPQMVEV